MTKNDTEAHADVLREGPLKKNCCGISIILRFFCFLLSLFKTTTGQNLIASPQDVSIIPPCVTSAMSVGNLNREPGNATQSNNNNNNNNSVISGSNNNNNNNNNLNNNRVCSAVSVGNVSNIPTIKVTGE